MWNIVVNRRTSGIFVHKVSQSPPLSLSTSLSHVIHKVMLPLLDLYILHPILYIIKVTFPISLHWPFFSSQPLPSLPLIPLYPLYVSPYCTFLLSVPPSCLSSLSTVIHSSLLFLPPFSLSFSATFFSYFSPLTSLLFLLSPPSHS